MTWDSLTRCHTGLRKTLSRCSRYLTHATKLSAYHDMPYAIFHYDPNEEFALRAQVTLLQTRLELRGKRVTSDIPRRVPRRSHAISAAS